MANIELHGMGVALITPFKEDDSVDYEALTRLIDHLVENGTDYIVSLGSTAETATLSADEKLRIKQLVVERVGRRIPVVLGVGGNCTRDVLHQLETADLHGIDALLSVVPYYNKPSQEGVYQHFKSIAKASPLPIVLYNVPGRTGTNMTAETTLRLAHEFPNIVAVKEASGNITQMDSIIKKKPSDFQVISGDDGITFPLIALGAVGVISVIGNAFPKEFSRMVRLALEGDYRNARIIHSRFMELFELLFVDGNPAGVKSLLNMMGFIDNYLRLPLVPTRITTFEKIREVLQKLNIRLKC
jgi:4-hydroxy-tetrahydrodipicolinate synthase